MKKKKAKAIDKQSKNQFKALEVHEKQLIKSSREKGSLKLLKQKEIFDELVNETRFEINKPNERTEPNLLYRQKCSEIFCPF